MAESQSGYDAEAYKNELDKISAKVMPEKWEGHGRLKIAERGFSDEKRTFAKKLLSRMKDKYPEQSATMLAEKVIDATEKQFD